MGEVDSVSVGIDWCRHCHLWFRGYPGFIWVSLLVRWALAGHLLVVFIQWYLSGRLVWIGV